MIEAELITLHANLKASFDSIDRWRDNEALRNELKPEQLQIAYTRKYTTEYSKFRAACAQLEATR